MNNLNTTVIKVTFSCYKKTVIKLLRMWKGGGGHALELHCIRSYLNFLEIFNLLVIAIEIQIWKKWNNELNGLNTKQRAFKKNL